MATRDAVRELGIDPKILGETRVNGLKGIVKREVKAGDGFRDYTTFTSKQAIHNSAEAKIRFLEQQLAYKEQEVEFLKKLYL